MEILNLDCFSGEKGAQWYQRASGLTIEAGDGSFNGGIINPKREHLKLGQYYYRFVSRGWAEEQQLGGSWWVDFETLHNIYGRFLHTGPSETAKQSRGPGAASRSTFREWLAVSFEWNLIEAIVVACLEARLDCYSGFGRRAIGGHAFDNRAFGMAPHLSNLFTIKQLCVPELPLHRKQAMPAAHILPFDQIDAVVRGRVA